MSKELFANAFVSYIGPTAALSTDTTLAIQDVTNLALTTGNFRVRCDQEIILVTAVTPGTPVGGVTPATFTVTRAQEGTTAAAHAIGAVIFAALTDQSLRNLCVQSHNDTVVTSRREVDYEDSASVTWTLTDDGTNDRVKLSAAAAGGTGEATFIAPVPTDFTWLNQGSATVTTVGSAQFLRAPATGGQDLRGLEITPGAAPWNVVAKIAPQMLNVNYSEVGLYYRDHTGGSMILANFSLNVFQVQHYTSPTAFGSTPVAANVVPGCGFTWIKLNDDGTNRNIYFSVDGNQWTLFLSESNTSYITADRVGWHAESNNGTYDACNKLLSWKFTSGSA